MIDDRQGLIQTHQKIEGTQPPKRKWNGALIAAVAFAVVVIVGLASLITTLGGAEETATSFEPQESEDTNSPVSANAIDASGAVANPSMTPLDLDGAVAGDGGVGPLGLGVVNELPGEDYLNFLFEFCQPECYRDAHFMDPNNPQVGSGVWTAGRPFHVRHGFINNSDVPLGEGFDVVLYVTPMDQPGEFGGVAIDPTLRYTSDYVLRGTSDQCGPTYKTQTRSKTCEWFVHDFPEGLPDGRFGIWAVWEAPCSAWVGLGFTDTCDDPTEVISLFSSGFDAPFGEFPPSFDGVNEAQLNPDER